MTLSPLSAAILATLLMYLLTALGAALVFPLRRFHPGVMNLLMALGAGIMLAASYFSLLAPALTSAHSLRQSPLLMCSGGFLLGGLLVLLADTLLSRRMRRTPLSDVRRRTVLLIGSITLHNIPEGLAVGCAFGALASPGGAAWRSAWMLAIGIALQNFPEGAAVSLPLFVLLRTVIRRSRAACGDSGRTAGDSRPRRPAPAAFALRRCHGDGHLGGASAGMPKMPAAASDGSRDAGGLCPHDGTGYDGVMATLGRCPKPCQRRCLWTLRRVFDPLDTHSRLPCSSHLPAVGLLLLLLFSLHILFQAFPCLPHLH